MGDGYRVCGCSYKPLGCKHTPGNSNTCYHPGCEYIIGKSVQNFCDYVDHCRKVHEKDQCCSSIESACEKGHRECASELVQKGYPLEYYDTSSASYQGKANKLQLLIEFGACKHPHAMDNAIMNGHTDCLKICIDNSFPIMDCDGKYINDERKREWRMINRAYAYETWNVLEYLVEDLKFRIDKECLKKEIEYWESRVIPSFDWDPPSDTIKQMWNYLLNH